MEKKNSKEIRRSYSPG